MNESILLDVVLPCSKINSSPCYVINYENNEKFVGKTTALYTFFQPRHQRRQLYT